MMGHMTIVLAMQLLLTAALCFGYPTAGGRAAREDRERDGELADLGSEARDLHARVQEHLAR